MIFNGVEFDDISKSEGTWSQICAKCVQSLDLPNIKIAPCGYILYYGVSGCENIADYYIDFPKE